MNSAYATHALSLSCYSSLRARNSFGLCLRIIVNETHIIINKTTSSVLSVIVNLSMIMVASNF